MTFSSIGLGIDTKPCEGQPSACGTCINCQRRAAVAIADHVLRSRYTDRGRNYDKSGPEEQRYAQRRVRLLLAMAGLTDIGTDEVQLASWGHAMRQIQLDTETDQ